MTEAERIAKGRVMTEREAIVAETEICWGCEKCPPEGDWICPVCDAEWPAIEAGAHLEGEGK